MSLQSDSDKFWAEYIYRNYREIGLPPKLGSFEPIIGDIATGKGSFHVWTGKEWYPPVRESEK